MKKYSVMTALFMAAALTAGALTACGGGKPAETTAAAAAETTTAEITAAETTSAAAETVAPPAETTEAETSAAAGADSDWYMKVLSDADLMKEYPYHSFVDVNGDGVPVLFLSTVEKSFIGGEDKACMIVYDAGSPKTVKEIGGAGGEKFICNTSEHTVTWFHRLSGEGHIEVFSLKDGELVPVTTVDSYGPHHYPEKDNAEQLFLQDGREISEEEHDALWAKYANEADEVTYTE